MDHESALGDRADLPIGVLSAFRTRISESNRTLGEDTDYRHCPCLQRRYCPQNNSLRNLPRKERAQYCHIPACFCGCTYCVDSPTLRTNLFPQAEAYGMTPVLTRDMPGVQCLNYGDVCYDNQRLEGYQIVTRNLQLMYQADPGRYSYSIRVPTSDGSGKTVKQRVFESKNGWGSDSEDDSPPFESVLNFDDVARSNSDELILQPTKIRRLNGYEPLSAEEFPSVHLGSFKDLEGITRVSTFSLVIFFVLDFSVIFETLFLTLSVFRFAYFLPSMSSYTMSWILVSNLPISNVTTKVIESCLAMPFTYLKLPYIDSYDQKSILIRKN